MYSCRNRPPHEICDPNADCVYDFKANDYICKCRSGFEGNGLRGKCYIDESFGLYLVYTQGSSLHRLSFRQDEEKSTPIKNRIVYIPGQTAVGVAYDCHEQHIYWTDVSGKVINRIRLDGSNYSVVLQNVKSAEGLAIDWISRNLYFTDSETKTIEVVSLDGRFRKVLIRSHLNNPRGIAVDPIDGYIFWTDWNRNSPKIERSNMDGTHRKVIVSNDLGVPNGLYFDQKRQEICWGDAKTKKIECVEKDGSNRRIVTQINTIYPFDLTEVRSNIYWSDWSKKEIQNVDKDGNIGMPMKLAPGGNGRVYGVVAVKNSCQKGTNACDRTNGGCNQLCLPRPDHTRQCACSDDSNLECLKSLTNN
ncbi:nidogen-1-like isoform X2 [Brachionus plicatilis]|uniref:Nidogen-1-like isoform X2 n=1 Tax=Brachionus plicatilis TaxID=10195 RepID=A0A3M7RIN7_BRAPC|nr:nidogen-1-like isoform X2 [Brachionus plicatilis]